MSSLIQTPQMNSSRMNSLNNGEGEDGYYSKGNPRPSTSSNSYSLSTNNNNPNNHSNKENNNNYRSQNGNSSTTAADEEQDNTPEDGSNVNNDGNITEGLIGKKRNRAMARVTLKETNILSAKGLWLLYDEMQKIPLQRTVGKEADDMRLVMATYREWAKQLYPKGNSYDTLQKCSQWSGKAVVKSVIQQMRVDIEIPRAHEGGNAINLKKYMEVTETARLRAEAELARRKEKIKGIRTDIDIPDEEEEDGDYRNNDDDDNNETRLKDQEPNQTSDGNNIRNNLDRFGGDQELADFIDNSEDEDENYGDRRAHRQPKPTAQPSITTISSSSDPSTNAVAVTTGQDDTQPINSHTLQSIDGTVDKDMNEEHDDDDDELDKLEQLLEEKQSKAKVTKTKKIKKLSKQKLKKSSIASDNSSISNNDSETGSSSSGSDSGSSDDSDSTSSNSSSSSGGTDSSDSNDSE